MKAMRIIEALRRHGFSAYLVGGCVRDKLLGHEPKDYDVVTTALPEEVASVLLNELQATPMEVGKQFGITIVNLGGENVEIATTRHDGPYSDGRRPDWVRTGVGIDQDSKRRDFTVNAMFQDPADGTIHDFHGGQDDLKNRLIRAVGAAKERIVEDRLRMLRAVRFAVKLGFEIEPELYDEICRRASELLETVAWERVRGEFSGILTSPQPRRGLRVLRDTGLLEQILPELPADELELAASRVESLAGHKFPVLLAGLVLPLGGETAGQVARKFVLPAVQARFVASAADGVLRAQEIDRWGWAEQAVFLARADGAAVEALLLAHAAASGQGPELAEVFARLRERADRLPAPQKPGAPALLTGQALVSAGFRPGQGIGNLLRAAYRLQLEGEFDSPESALAWAKTQL